jgi:anti-anti-sigma factor
MSLSHTEPSAPTPAPIVVKLAGELDLASAGALTALNDAVISCSRGQVIVDLTNVTFLDSFVLNAFVSAHDEASTRGGSVTLRGGSEHVHRLLHICHLDRLLSPTDPHDPVA